VNCEQICAKGAHNYFVFNKLNWTLVEAKMFTFTLESTHFIFNKCPIYTHDGASAKFSTNSHETDYSVCAKGALKIFVFNKLNFTLAFMLFEIN
jgi:hypothetical protein